MSRGGILAVAEGRALVRSALVLVILCATLGCAEEDALDQLPAEGEPVDPPFEVRGEAEGLLLVWFDAEGLHTASTRSEIPAERRATVRVDDLSLAPEERLDPELVYVADLRRAREDGSYPVRQLLRTSFEERVSAATAQPVEPAATASAEPNEDADVVIYGASWCNACRSAAAFLRERQVEFVERDIERDPGAREAMQRAARAAGLTPRGIPVIDFRGRIIQGFDRGALERAIAQARTPI